MNQFACPWDCWLPIHISISIILSTRLWHRPYIHINNTVYAPMAPPIKNLRRTVSLVHPSSRFANKVTDDVSALSQQHRTAGLPAIREIVQHHQDPWGWVRYLSLLRIVNTTDEVPWSAQDRVVVDDSCIHAAFKLIEYGLGWPRRAVSGTILFSPPDFWFFSVSVDNSSVRSSTTG